MQSKNFNSSNSLDVLQECFRNFSPQESKDLLWKFFSLAVSGSFGKQPVKVRENLVAFYSHLQQVLDVVGELVAEGEEEGKSAQSRIFKNIPKNPE